MRSTNSRHLTLFEYGSHYFILRSPINVHGRSMMEDVVDQILLLHKDIEVDET